jgi:hypothetical protein
LGGAKETRRYTSLAFDYLSPRESPILMLPRTAIELFDLEKREIREVVSLPNRRTWGGDLMLVENFR